MIGQILPNNNERCYINFSPTFREVNTPITLRQATEIMRIHTLPSTLGNPSLRTARGGGSNSCHFVFEFLITLSSPET
jgi:hypothetical protein